MIDITKNKEILEKINFVLNSGDICEVKNEKKQGCDNIVVVKIQRKVIKG